MNSGRAGLPKPILDFELLKCCALSVDQTKNGVDQSTVTVAEGLDFHGKALV